MTPDEADEFVNMVNGAWAGDLSDVQADLWRGLVRDLDAAAAFSVIVRMFRSEGFRPSAQRFMEGYRREMIDRTPTQPEQPTDPDEMPPWVGGWNLARRENDNRRWPEQEIGCRQLPEHWVTECLYTTTQQRRLGLKSGYEWTDSVAQFGLMPQADRLEYIRRAQSGEAPRTAEEVAVPVMAGEAEAETPATAG